MKRFQGILFFLFLMGVSSVCPGSDTIQKQDPARLIDSYMSKDGLPSLSVAVGRNGEVLYTGASGFSDIENGLPATVSSVYRIGSVSKLVTATAVMQLSESGQIELDLPIQTYCPSFPDKETGITPRLLLAHLGGIRHYNYRRFTEEFLSNKRYESMDDALVVFKDDPLVEKPGEKQLYSSFGFVLLGCAVEGASGESFGDYIDKHVTRVLGMDQTRLDIAEDDIPNRTRYYSRSQDGGVELSPQVDLSDRYPAGGFLATPKDLVVFGEALLEGRLLGQETWTAMISPQKSRSGEDHTYGLGWRISDPAGEVFHGGTSVGGSAYLYIRVETGTVVAIATNVDRWTEARRELARALADWSESQ